MSLFFPFIAILSVSHPTGSNGRSAKKGLFFALWKNDITDVSLFASYCYFIQEACHRFRKKKVNFLAKQTICLRTLNEQTPMRKYLCVYWRKFQSSSLGVCCLNEIPFVASCLSARKRKRIQNNVGNKVQNWLIGNSRQSAVLWCICLLEVSRLYFFFRTLTTKEKTMEKLAINL